MLKLAVIFAVALGCHGVYVPSVKLVDGEDPTVQDERYSPNPSFRLYTRSNVWNDITLDASNVGTLDDIKTIILVHGHRGSYLTSLNPEVRLAILEFEAANVISMDWQASASNSYSQALSQVKFVAGDLRAFLGLLTDATSGPGISLQNIQIVGFNLGAHVAGIAARGLGIARITGLDPSGDGWGPLSDRLNQRDANYVEVLHTDGGHFGNGIGEAIGRVDFFINGGSDQPGCSNRLCSHNRAHEVYAASINKRLTGNKCDSQSQINLNRCRGSELPLGNTAPDKLANGIYRANTGRPPFK